MVKMDFYSFFFFYISAKKKWRKKKYSQTCAFDWRLYELQSLICVFRARAHALKINGHFVQSLAQYFVQKFEMMNILLFFRVFVSLDLLFFLQSSTMFWKIAIIYMIYTFTLWLFEYSKEKTIENEETKPLYSCLKRIKGATVKLKNWRQITKNQWKNSNFCCTL